LDGPLFLFFAIIVVISAVETIDFRGGSSHSRSNTVLFATDKAEVFSTETVGQSSIVGSDRRQ
jgi:hypothetical protein